MKLTESMPMSKRFQISIEWKLDLNHFQFFIVCLWPCWCSSWYPVFVLVTWWDNTLRLSLLPLDHKLRENLQKETFVNNNCPRWYSFFTCYVSGQWRGGEVSPTGHTKKLPNHTVYIPTYKAIYHNRKGGSLRVMVIHCTPHVLTSWIYQNVGK